MHHRALHELVGQNPSAAPEASALLVDLTERLLDTYAVAVANGGGGGGGGAVEAADAAGRQEMLQALFEEAVRLATAGEWCSANPRCHTLWQISIFL